MTYLTYTTHMTYMPWKRAYPYEATFEPGRLHRSCNPGKLFGLHVELQIV
jgi:hypothetical protein